jgi:hypothetical protein
MGQGRGTECHTIRKLIYDRQSLACETFGEEALRGGYNSVRLGAPLINSTWQKGAKDWCWVLFLLY